ncbi:AIR synthase related protein [Buchnera aphidicola]|uniref:AIR synthase related protein n=1 Tax=Buchnera aphidicola TaxID=9 RepID=UPI0031B882A7
MSTNTLVKGLIFFKNISPNDLAYKTAAVNLNDIAAMDAYFKMDNTIYHNT